MKDVCKKKRDITTGKNLKKSWIDLNLPLNYLQSTIQSLSKLCTWGPRKLKRRYEKDTWKQWKYWHVRPPGFESWVGLIYYLASITAQGLPEPSSLRGSTLGTRAAEHKGCNWGMQLDWCLQPRAVFGHTFSGIIWHMPQKWSQLNCMTLSWWPCHKIVSVTFTFTLIESIRFNTDPKQLEEYCLTAFLRESVHEAHEC